MDAKNGWGTLNVPRDDLASALNVRDVIVREPSGIRNWNGLRARTPALEQAFVGDFHNDPDGFRKVCRALPGIRVWHLDLNAGRLASTVFLLFATLLLGGAVMQQATAAFSLPQTRMYPRFALPHLIIPLAICGLGIIAASFVARRYGTDFWAAGSAQALGWGIWATLEFTLMPLRQNLLRTRTSSGAEPGAASGSEVRARWIEAVTLIVVIAGVFLILIARPYVLESFLLGELPWLNAGILAVGATLGAAAVVLAPTLVAELNEKGIAPVLSMQDVEKRRSGPMLAAPFRRRLQLPQRPLRGQTWWWRLRAMQCGNPELLTPVLIKLIGPILVLAVCEKVFALLMFARVFLILLLAVGWIVALSSVFSVWWQRRKIFSVQLLYPWTRGQMTRAAFAAYALDAAGLPALFCATFVVCNSMLGWVLGPRAILTGFVVAIGALSLLVTGGLWLLTLRHRLLASFLALAGTTLLIVWIGFSWQILTRMDTRQLLSAALLPAALIAFLLTSGAYRRWMTHEWGQFGSS
jgi:hypothetical protein